MSNKKMLITASSFPWYEGSTKGNFILEYAQVMSRYYDVYVLTHKIDGMAKDECIEGVFVHRYDFIPFSFLNKYFKYGVLNAFGSSKLLFLLCAPIYVIGQIRAIHKVNKEHKFDILHAHWIIPQGLCALIYTKIFNRNLKVLATIHGGDIFAFNGRLARFVKKWVISNLDALSVVSTHIANTVRELKVSMKGDMKVLPMGVDISKFSPTRYSKDIRASLDPFNKIILFVGRFSEKKGISFLIEAMVDVVHEYKDACLVLAGDGELRMELEAQVDNLGLRSNVKFLGSVPHDELPVWYATADVFVGPSIVSKTGDSEGFGLVFVESAVSGTLVITSDFDSMKDIVKNDVTGIVVKQESSEELAEAIIGVFISEDKTSEIVSNALVYSTENFGWDVIAKQYDALITKLLSK